jgi:hypothetical protein
VSHFERSLRALRARSGGFRVVEYSIQSNHAHFVIEAESAAELGRGMKALGTRLARLAKRTFATTGAVLRDRYHMRELRTPREVRNALAYVLLNVRKHRAQHGLATTPAQIDVASSGRWFAWFTDARTSTQRSRRRTPSSRARQSQGRARPPLALPPNSLFSSVHRSARSRNGRTAPSDVSYSLRSSG